MLHLPAPTAGYWTVERCVQKEPPCNSLTGADLLHKIQVILLHQAALLVFLMGHLPAHRVQVAVDVRTAGQDLDLKLDGRDFQVRNEGVDNIPLLPGAPQHKVDRDNLDHLDKPMVFGIDNAVLHLLNGQIIRHRIEAGGLLLLDMGRAFRQAPLFRALLCFLFRLISLGRTLLFGIFLGPQLFTDLIAAHFIKLGRKICLTRPPTLRGLWLFLLGRPLLEMLAGDLEGAALSSGCSPSPPTTRRFRRYFKKMTRNCERLSPDMPIKATSPTGRAVRHKMMMRVVSPNGRNRKTGAPMANTRMPASITFRARNIPPKKVPVSIKFGGMI